LLVFHFGFTGFDSCSVYKGEHCLADSDRYLLLFGIANCSVYLPLTQKCISV